VDVMQGAGRKGKLENRGGKIQTDRIMHTFVTMCDNCLVIHDRIFRPRDAFLCSVVNVELRTQLARCIVADAGAHLTMWLVRGPNNRLET